MSYTRPSSGKALLTGGAGFVGSHVNQRLTELGWRTVILDDLSTGHADAVRWGTLEHGNILDTDKVIEVLRRHEIDAVLHFAGLISVGESTKEPERYHHVNVEGSASVLAAMRSCEVRSIVFSSSAAVYGTPEVDGPIVEDTLQSPLSPYGQNKADVELLLQAAQRDWGLHHVSLRYFNACGADPSGAIGEQHDPETHLIPLVLDAASGRRSSIDVFGTDYPTPDGTCIRDYVHVCDLATAHALALQYAMSGRSGAFNLGTGHGASVREVIGEVERVTGLPVPVTETPRRAGDPPFLVADGSLAREVLGWRPERSDLPTIIEDAWRWHQHGGYTD